MKKSIFIGILIGIVVACGVGYAVFASGVLDKEAGNSENDEKYIAAVHKILPNSEKMDDEDIIASGEGLCASLDLAGPDITRTELVDVAWGFTQGADGWVDMEDTGAMMGNAIEYYCPEYRDDVERAVLEGGF